MASVTTFKTRSIWSARYWVPVFAVRMHCGNGSGVRQRKHDRGDRPSGLDVGGSTKKRRHVFVSDKSQRFVASDSPPR